MARSCMRAVEAADEARPEGGLHFGQWLSPHVGGLEIVESSTHRHRYPRHLHEAMEIIWVRHGRCTIECRDRRHLLQAGEACVVRPFECHSGGALGEAPVRFCLIHVPVSAIPPGFLSLYFRDPDSGGSSRIKLLPRRVADALLPGIVTSLLAGNDLDAQCRNVATSLDALLEAELRQRSSRVLGRERHPAIEYVTSIIGRRYAEALKVESLASEVALQQNYFISLFRDATGVPPHQFQIALRVDHARRLLPSLTPLSSVAALSGFADQSHLNRHFKRQYGFTPGMFRRLHLAG